MNSKSDIRQHLKSAKLLAEESLALLKAFHTTIEQAEMQVSASKKAIERSRQKLRAFSDEPR